MLRPFVIPKSRFIFNSTSHSLVIPTSSRTIFSRMSSSSSSSSNSETNQQVAPQSEENKTTTTEHKPQLTLPAPGDVTPLAPANDLQVNGPDLKLDHLGPVVVNENGTISRIDNWHEMTEIEKSNVKRILVLRNNKRLAKLRAEQDKQAQKQQD